MSTEDQLTNHTGTVIFVKGHELFQQGEMLDGQGGSLGQRGLGDMHKPDKAQHPGAQNVLKINTLQDGNPIQETKSFHAMLA